MPAVTAVAAECKVESEIARFDLPLTNPRAFGSRSRADQDRGDRLIFHRGILRELAGRNLSSRPRPSFASTSRGTPDCAQSRRLQLGAAQHDRAVRHRRDRGTSAPGDLAFGDQTALMYDRAAQSRSGSPQASHA